MVTMKSSFEASHRGGRSRFLWMAPWALAAVLGTGCGNHSESAAAASAPAELASQQQSAIGKGGPSTLPPPTAARYLKLVALSESNGQPFSAIAELNLLDATGAVIDRRKWAVSADSADANDPASHAIDGDPRTLWHSRWQGTPAPLPHEFVIDLGETMRVTGLRYLPRQDGTGNGSIGEYRIHLSADGVRWGEPIIAGSFAGDLPNAERTVVFAPQTVNRAPTVLQPPSQSTALGSSVSLQIGGSDADGDPIFYSALGLPPGLSVGAKTGVIAGTPIEPGRYRVELRLTDNKSEPAAAEFDWTVVPPAPLAAASAPAPGEVRFVKLEALSEVNGQPWTSMAEFNLLDEKGTPVARAGWVVSADSADTSDKPENAVDGNSASLWHTQWDGSSPPPPHRYIVDMRGFRKIGGFSYLPRQDKSSNGTIAKYRFYTSVDGLDWRTPVAQGDFSTQGPAATEKTVRFR